jgi:hypothetical protein
LTELPKQAANTITNSKEVEEMVLKFMDGVLSQGPTHVDGRWMAIARTHVEQGFMAIERALTQPARYRL